MRVLAARAIASIKRGLMSDWEGQFEDIRPAESLYQNLGDADPRLTFNLRRSGQCAADGDEDAGNCRRREKRPPRGAFHV